jgi:hypothetical protein
MRRLLIAFALFLICASRVDAALAVVQEKGVFNPNPASTTAAITITSSVSGNLLIALVMNDASQPTVSGVSGGGANTFTQVPSARALDGGTHMSDIWYLPNNAGGITTVTATLSASSSSHGIWVMEVSGAATASPVDIQSVKNNATASTTVTGTSMNTTNAADIIVANWTTGATTTTANAPWTLFTNILNGNGAGYQIVAVTNSYAVSANQNSSQTYCVSQVAFKGTAAAAPCTRSLLGVGCLP